MIVAAAVVLIVVGCWEIVARWLVDSGSPPPAAVHGPSPAAAPARPAVSSAVLPEAIPLPPDGVNPGALPGTSPPAGPPPSGKPAQSMNDKAPPEPDEPAAGTAPAGPAPDVTGALPRPLAPPAGAIPAAAAAMSKLPAAIGTPALRAAALAGDAAAYVVAMRFAEGRGSAEQ